MASRALCIGVNDYPGTQNDLHGCVNDARDWAKELERRGFGVELLLDRKASGASIRRRIKALVGEAAPGDTIVVQFSGHGSFVPDTDGDEPDGTDECLCPADVSSGYITDDELFELFSARKPDVHAVMIADSCHSGTIAKFAPLSTPAAVARSGVRRLVRFLPPAAFLQGKALGALGHASGIRRATPPGRQTALTLTGCQDTEFSYDGFFSGRPNGVFTYVALQTLKSLPARATYRQWHAAIRKRLPSRQYPQTPNLYGTAAMKSRPIFAGG